MAKFNSTGKVIRTVYFVLTYPDILTGYTRHVVDFEVSRTFEGEEALQIVSVNDKVDMDSLPLTEDEKKALHAECVDNYRRSL